MLSFYKLVATGLGVGYSPVAPGTCGAILGVLIYYLLHFISGPQWAFTDLHLFALIIIFTGLGIVASKHLEKIWGEDAQKIVIDETVGQWITLLFIPFHWKYILMALVLFRLFDIWKPLYIRRVEHLPNGIGVMMDDVIAGIYGLIVLQLMITLGF